MSDGSDANPKAPGAPPASVAGPTPPHYDDEISLRELFLILRRGLPLILVVTVLAVVVSFGIVVLQPDIYEAEATVVSSPTTVQVEDEGVLAFAPTSSISFDTYEAIATSRAVFDATLASLGDDDVETPADFRELRNAAGVVRLSGPSDSNPGASLTVVHRISWRDPALSAAYADAWATATVEQVRATLLADLEPTRVETLRAIEASDTALEASDAAFSEFEAKDLDDLRRQLIRLSSSRLSVIDELATLDVLIARLTGELEVLADASGGVSVPVSEGVLTFLRDSGRVDPETIARLRSALPADDAAPLDVQTLLARTDFQSTSVELAGRVAERETLEDSLGVTTDAYEQLHTRIVELEQEARAVSRNLEEATATYEALKAIEPALAFVADLTPSNTRVLNSAQEPLSAAGLSPILVGLLAAVVAFLSATLFVFLREAVREPAGMAPRSRA